MSEDMSKAVALAEKITLKAERALDGILREMVIMKWPAEFRAIMWGAVADLAGKHRDAAEADKR